MISHLCIYIYIYVLYFSAKHPFNDYILNVKNFANIFREKGKKLREFFYVNFFFVCFLFFPVFTLKYNKDIYRNVCRPRV